MELKRYWSVVRKRWWMVALIMIISCTAVGYYSNHFLIPQYEASAKLIVNQNGGGDSRIPNLDVGTISSNILLIKTYKEIIRSPRIMDKVVQQFPELHASSDELSAKIGVSSINETQVMSVTAQDESYERAAKMANAVSRVFQQEIRTLMKLDNVSVLNWADPAERRGPVAPNPTLNIMIAFVLSMMAGIVLAFVLEAMDDTVRTEQDIRTQLGIPLLAAIPKMKPGELAGRGKDVRIMNPAGRDRNVTIDA